MTMVVKNTLKATLKWKRRSIYLHSKSETDDIFFGGNFGIEKNN